MIRGTVTRGPSGPLGTRGRLELESGFSCDTLELPWRGNQRGVSCVLADTYRGRAWFSPTLRRVVVRFDDQNGREDVLIHNGNWAADARDVDGDGRPEVTQVHGCTEVGRGYGDIRRPDGVTQWGILRSTATLEELMRALQDGSPTSMGAGGFMNGFHELEMLYRWADDAAPADA